MQTGLNAGINLDQFFERMMSCYHERLGQEFKEQKKEHLAGLDKGAGRTTLRAKEKDEEALLGEASRVGGDGLGASGASAAPASSAPAVVAVSFA
jgi:hypothetical protein